MQIPSFTAYHDSQSGDSVSMQILKNDMVIFPEDADWHAPEDLGWSTKIPDIYLTVKKGDKGTSVRWVQDKLKKAGYKLSVDGIFGLGTLNAVKKFQKAKKLTVDGLVGPKTKQAL